MMALAASAVVATAVCCALWCALSLAADRDREQRMRDLWVPRPSTRRPVPRVRPHLRPVVAALSARTQGRRRMTAPSAATAAIALDALESWLAVDATAGPRDEWSCGYAAGVRYASHIVWLTTIGHPDVGLLIRTARRVLDEAL
jgi:hypothetical protein